MADNIGSLYVRLGLSLSELETGFVTAEQTVRQGIATLNRQQNIVKLKMEADTAGLDAIADKSKILAIQEQALTQILEMQRDKLKLATAAYQDLANSKNANSAAVQNSQAAMERERLAVARLEAQLKSLSGQKLFIDTTQLQESIAKINAKIQHIRITAEIDTSKLKSAGSVFDEQKAHVNALTKELELQRQKLIQLREAMYQSAKATGGGSVQTLNIKSNVLQQIQEINRLETKLKEIQNTNINLQIRADSIKKAEADIQENISRINAKIEHVRVKTDIDVSKLGTVATEFDRAKAHVQGLNRELTLQNQKLAEMRKALSTSISANGLNNVKTITLSTEIQKQIQAIDQLKAKIDELNKIQPPQTNNFLSNYLNIKGDVVGKLNEITSAFSQLKGATSSADSAITSTLGVIGTIPHPVGRAVAALASLPLVFKGVENSIISMTRAAAEAGDATYVMSRGMQMSLKDAGKFSTNAKVAGTEVNSLKMAIQQVQRQIVKGGDDSRAAEWLKRYGESARDANGNLKNLNDMTFALSRALHKAQEEGKGAEFVFSVFRNISADDITAIEDWIAVNEQASKIVKNGLANPALAHEVKGNLNALAVQEGQLKASFESALLPVANEIIPRITERMGKLTQVIADNKDVILDFGRDFAEVWGAVEDTIDKVGEGVGELAKLARENRVVRQTDTKTIVERYKNDKTVQNAEDILKKEIAAGGYSDEDISRLRARNDLYLKEIKRTGQDAKALLAERRKAFAEANKPILEKYKYDNSIKTATDLLNRLTDEEQQAITQTDSAFGSLLERAAALNLELQNIRRTAEGVKKFSNVSEAVVVGAQALGVSEEQKEQLKKAKEYYQEAADIRAKMKYGDYQYQRYALNRWGSEKLSQEELSETERLAILEDIAAKSAQIEQERADKLAEIRASVEAADKTALQNKLDTIEKERQAWLKAGMDEAESVELAQKKIAKAYEEAEQKVKGHYQNAADIEYELTHTAFEKQIRDIELWKEAQEEKAETAEEISSIVAEAAAKEAQAFENEMDRIKGKLQSLDDKIFDIDHSQYEKDMRRIQQDYLNQAREYQEMGIFTPEIKAKLDYLYFRQKQSIDKQAVESRTKGGDYTKKPEGSYGGGMPIGLFADTSGIETMLYSKLNTSAQNEVNKLRGAEDLAPARQELQQFGEAVKQTADSVQSFDSSTQGVADAQKNLDDRIKILTESTGRLVEAQDDLVGVLKSLPTVNPPHDVDNKPTGKLHFAQKVKENALKIAESAPNSDSGVLKVFGSTQKVSGSQYYPFSIATGVEHILEELSGSLLPESILQKDSKLTKPVTTMPAEVDLSALSGIDSKLDSVLQAIQDSQPHEADRLQELFGTLPNIEAGIQDILLALQSEESQSYITDSLQELFGELPNISANVQSILTEMQTAKEIPDTADMPALPAVENMSALPAVDYMPTLNAISGKMESILQAVQSPVSFETVITPLNRIEGVIDSILKSLSNREPPQINISPNNNIDLGGAYVFDNALKKQLVDDITSQIVDKITTAVRQATSRSSYGYGA